MWQAPFLHFRRPGSWSPLLTPVKVVAVGVEQTLPSHNPAPYRQSKTYVMFKSIDLNQDQDWAQDRVRFILKGRKTLIFLLSKVVAICIRSIYIRSSTVSESHYMNPLSRERVSQSKARPATDPSETRTSSRRGHTSILFDQGKRILHQLFPILPNAMATSGDEADVSSVGGEETSLNSDGHGAINRSGDDDQLAAALHYIWTLKQTKRENRLSSRRMLLERASSSRRTVYSQNHSRQASVADETTPLVSDKQYFWKSILISFNDPHFAIFGSLADGE